MKENQEISVRRKNQDITIAIDPEEEYHKVAEHINKDTKKIYIAESKEEAEDLLNSFDIDEQACRICGCTWHNACLTEEGTCYWVEEDLCSACIENNNER